MSVRKPLIAGLIVVVVANRVRRGLAARAHAAHWRRATDQGTVVKIPEGKPSGA